MSSRAYSADIEELLNLGTMCRELSKENDLLRESLSLEQSESNQRIKKLELDVNVLSEALSKDKKLMEKLESQIRNSSLQIEYLQDQLHLKTVEANCVAEHVHSLELKLLEFGNLSEKMHQMRNNYVKSESDRVILMQALEQKELDLQNSARCINKLEATISSNTLEFQCEIETLMLDLSACEERCAQLERHSDQCARETAKMASLRNQLDDHLLERQQMIDQLKNEKESLQERLEEFKQRTISFCCKVDEYIYEQEKDCSQCRTNMSSHRSVPIALEDGLPIEKEMRIGEEIFGPLLSKLAVLRYWEKKLLDKRLCVSSDLSDSKLVKELQEELRAEKSKANEDAEDLAQEMAELRYNTTELLEEEHKRHAFIEQASLLRIKELEANVCDEHRKLLAAERHLLEAEELSEARYKKILRLNDTLLNLQTDKDLKTIVQKVETCTCGACGLSELVMSSHTS